MFEMGQCKGPAHAYALHDIGRAPAPVPNEAEPGLLGTPGTASQDGDRPTATRSRLRTSGFADGFDGTRAKAAG
ncbi:hypothetical protein TM102_62770 [Bradyrhizobium sp. TM102]|nr:hypothetical protein TM102_62770 [Bradyrhizobium sp. TM102]